MRAVLVGRQQQVDHHEGQQDLRSERHEEEEKPVEPHKDRWGSGPHFEKLEREAARIKQWEAATSTFARREFRTSTPATGSRTGCGADPLAGVSRFRAPCPCSPSR